MTRGEVWWYEEPDRKPRPVLILTRSEAVPVLNHIIAAPTTSTIRGIPTEVSLDRADGVPESCAVNLDSTFSARRALLTEHIATLGPAKMFEVCQALAMATSC